MRGMLGLVVLAAVAADARADERATTVTLGGAGAFHDATGDVPAESVGGPRLTFTWEHAPLAIPDHRGTDVEPAISPELVAGANLHADRAEGMLGVGLRVELRMASRDQGLFHITSRGGVYLAARALVIGKHQDAAGELVFGDYLCIGRGRFGVELGELARRNREAMDPVSNFVVQMYVGWAM